MKEESASSRPWTGQTVVLIHGLYTHGLIMEPLARRLRAAGYRAITFSYPSVRRRPADNAKALGKWLGGLDGPRVHLLAHSLGGLIVRHLLADCDASLASGRVVTLGTPHQGSLVARSLNAHRLRFMLRRSGEGGLLQGMPPWLGQRELGSIAGTRNIGLGRLVSRLPGPADGSVTVAETRLPGMTDHICLPVSHTQMLFSGAVAAQVCHFLATGRFHHHRKPRSES